MFWRIHCRLPKCFSLLPGWARVQAYGFRALAPNSFFRLSEARRRGACIHCSVLALADPIRPHSCHPVLHQPRGFGGWAGLCWRSTKWIAATNAGFASGRGGGGLCHHAIKMVYVQEMDLFRQRIWFNLETVYGRTVFWLALVACFLFHVCPTYFSTFSTWMGNQPTVIEFVQCSTHAQRHGLNIHKNSEETKI